MEGPGIAYAIAQPDAVRWSPPTLLGLLAAKPFALTAGYAPYMKSMATAQVEVLAAVDPAGLRVVPSTTPPLAPGQTVSLAVEQQLPGSEQWKEVRPDAVSWTVPAEAIWEPATATLRPALTVPPDAKGEFELRAEFAGKEAVATIGVKDQGLDAADPADRLVAVRQPGGQYLPVGSQQRYTIMVEDKDGRREPASDVRWSGDFENKYVKWQAPVLTAKEPAAPSSGSAPTWADAPCFCTPRPTCRATAWWRRRPSPPTPRSRSSSSATRARRCNFPWGPISTTSASRPATATASPGWSPKKAMLTTPEPPAAPGWRRATAIYSACSPARLRWRPSSTASTPGNPWT